MENPIKTKLRQMQLYDRKLASDFDKCIFSINWDGLNKCKCDVIWRIQPDLYTRNFVKIQREYLEKNRID
jgi:hypothetical protein